MEDARSCRERLRSLENRLPWQSVNKAWSGRREHWLSSLLSHTFELPATAKLLLTLEAALKADALDESWAANRESWRMRVPSCTTADELGTFISELNDAIQWSRVSDAALAARPIPPPSVCDRVDEPPPEGVPRLALRVMLMLRSMGVRDYHPGVVLQLMETAYGYTSDLLQDALAYSRLRQHAPSAPPEPVPSQGRKRPLAQSADSADAGIAYADVELAARMRAGKVFTRPSPREVMAQGAVDLNSRPLPLLERESGVRLPLTTDCIGAVRVCQDIDDELPW